MYIVRNYTALMHLDPTGEINSVLTPIPFNNPYGYLGRIVWPAHRLLYRKNYLIRYQPSTPYRYPPDTDPHNNTYTYMPIGASIHDTQHIHDFENHSNYINLLAWYLNANS